MHKSETSPEITSGEAVLKRSLMVEGFIELSELMFDGDELKKEFITHSGTTAVDRAMSPLEMQSWLSRADLTGKYTENNHF